MEKHPAAHDPFLQEKVDELCKFPRQTVIKFEIEKLELELEYQRRTVRAMNRGIDGLQRAIHSLRATLKDLPFRSHNFSS